MDKMNVYVCSKPLQYFNARNIPRENGYKNVLFIEDKFKNANEFYKKVKLFDNSWDKVILVRNRLELFFLCTFRYRPTNFYYFLDWLLVPGLLLYILPAKNKYIYEEGVGSYRKDIFESTPKYRRVIRSLLGLSEFPGFHPRVKGIYVYCENFYYNQFRFHKARKPPVTLAFDRSFSDMISLSLELAEKLFDFDPSCFSSIQNKKVALYISTWPFNEFFLNDIDLAEYDYCLVKPHPHITHPHLHELIDRNPKLVVMDTGILSEFVIKILLNRNNILDIYHHGSTSVVYLDIHPGIRIIKNLNNAKSNFDLIYTGIQLELGNLIR